MPRLLVAVLAAFFISLKITAAQTALEGYTYEENNRGRLQQVQVTVYEMPANIVRAELRDARRRAALALVDLGMAVGDPSLGATPADTPQP